MPERMPERATFPLVAHVLVFNAAGQLLLGERSGSGFMDGWWVPPGGHVEAGEQIEAAALRELREEVVVGGVTQLDPVAVLPYRSGRHSGVNFVFAATADDGEIEAVSGAGFGRVQWFGPEDLPERVAPWVADALELVESPNWFRELTY